MNTTAKHVKAGESSALRGWLSAFLADIAGDDAQGNRRRLVLATALALALVEIVAMSIPSRTYAIPEQPIERITIAKIIRIEHRPRPTPKPTPRPIVRTKLVAQTHVQPRVVSPAAPSHRAHVRRVASAKPVVRTHAHSKPLVHVKMGGEGTGSTVNAKVATGGIGPGGTGTGESGTGTGTGGAPAAHEPCGYVDFAPNGKPTYDSKTGRVWEYLAIVVHFPDGSEQSVDLDYPFYYNSEAEDPFISGHENIPATFQPPPPSQAASEPPLVQYVMAHTSADGFTLLHECPKH